MVSTAGEARGGGTSVGVAGNAAAGLKHRIVTRCKLHHLRVVLEVSRQESVSRAASVLHLAQPSVTKTLHEVESLLGTALFERRPRGVVLNAAGQIVLPHIEALFAQLNRIGDDLAALGSGHGGSVAVGGTMTVLPYLLPQSLITLAASRPGSIVRVSEGTIDRMIQALDRGEIDLVLGRVLGGPGHDVFTQEILFDDPFVPVVGADHPLATAAGAAGTLSDYAWILPPEGSSARGPLERYLLRNGIRVSARPVETVSFQVTSALLERSHLVAVMPRHLARLGVARRSLAIVGPEIGEESLPVGLTYRSDRALHPLARAVATAFRETVALLPGGEVGSTRRRRRAG